MATKRNVLLKRLALAREAKAGKNDPKAEKNAPKAPPKPEPKEAPDMGIVTNPARKVAADVTEMAMVAGWDLAIQKHAYENQVPEQRIREMLDEAYEYQDKADPSGRIEGLQDWQNEKRGNSTLAAPSRN